MQISENSARKYHQYTMKISAKIRVQNTKSLYLEEYCELEGKTVISMSQTSSTSRLRRFTIFYQHLDILSTFLREILCEPVMNTPKYTYKI